jgi:Secretion system C-terminal sorting domain
MKAFYTTLGILLLGFSQILAQPAVLNGDFETNTAGACQINLPNASYTAMMPNSTAFGSNGNMDIMPSFCGYGTVQSGAWMTCFTAAGSDAISLRLATPLVSGNTYTYRFYDRAWFPLAPTQSFIVTLSTSASAHGPVIYSAPMPIDGVWSLRTFTFTAPNSGQYLTFRTGGAVQFGVWTELDNVGVSAILPLQEIPFQAKRVDELSVKVVWEELGAANTDYYVIERSEDGMNFNTVGRRDKLEGEPLTAFSFRDENPMPFTTWYRLRMIDREGNPYLSDVAKVEPSGENLLGNLTVSPNPNNGHFSLTLSDPDYSGRGHIQICDVQGKIVFESNPEGMALVQYELQPDLNPGVYVLRLTDGARSRTSRFTVN